MTRRKFLELVGQAGGASAVYGAMSALGLMAQPPTTARSGYRFELRGNGNGRRVLILGAGLAGLCAAYELQKIGYDCQILEARTRAGGRAHTIRRGTTEIESDGRSQTCTFDEGEYFNCGATRIPQQHCTLDYCRELGVAVEQWGNLNESAFLYREDGGALSHKRVRLHEARADMYGYVAELLAKAIGQKDLDQRLSADDKQQLLHYLAVEGGLSADMLYHGSNRRGYSSWPGAFDRLGKGDEPFPISAIIQSGFGTMFSFNWGIEQQSIMFQIVGGTDRLPRAFADRVRDSIELGARVTEIRQTPGSVEVAYIDRIGRAQEASAEFCICTIPLPVLKSITADFVDRTKRAIAAVEYESAVKVGLQFKRRFWEEDDRIFAGISRTDQCISQIMYPSHGFLGKKGVLIGCYNFSEQSEEMGRLKPEARIERALTEGGKIHPQYRDEFENGFSVAWQKTPFSMGAYASYRMASRREHYPVLCEPDRRVYLAGEHMSWLTGWMGGALDSARSTASRIHERAERENRT
ncbi:MAG: flavin monoamine oxidase family protein [Anaerolineae bacterium]|nr:flavin monoamine oxidase family protein [Phycisphaerae bacterium]